MKPWPKYPTIYEINTWVWLHELGRGKMKPVTLATVTKQEWDAIASLGFDAVWFMGVWERSPAGIRIAMGNQGLLDDFRRALPDFTEADNVGSPYCIRNYEVDPRLGGKEGLAKARKELAQRGMRLVLDFVPNHVAPDHPWVAEHPDYFIQGDYSDSVREPAAFYTKNGHVFACGRDPYFPAWPDVLQLNAFNDELRQAIVATVNSIAAQCDGIRCDMAMLVLNGIFQRTWAERAGMRPELDYWPEVIGTVKKDHTDFLFIAEAYWDLEWEIQQQGFDYCYDKKLYDRLEHDSAESIRLHLCADDAYQERLVRFIENHDEPRAASAFDPEKERAAAVTTMTLPGAMLLHEGQFEGRKIRLPVFLGRRPDEPPDKDLESFYHRLLEVITGEGLRKGSWRLCEREGWPDNESFLNLVTWSWHGMDKRHLVIVNLSGRDSQGRVMLPWSELEGHSWKLHDLLTGEVYTRDGRELRKTGLFVDLGPWKFHLIALRPQGL